MTPGHDTPRRPPLQVVRGSAKGSAIKGAPIRRPTPAEQAHRERMLALHWYGRGWERGSVRAWRRACPTWLACGFVFGLAAGVALVLVAAHFGVPVVL